jgi:outer membrane protein OmpA-like peptidoglycan-associated protein
VIEVERMQENMVVVDADAMAKGIVEEGRIALYGILFDYDSANIKPASRPTLEQIAALMNGNPDLELVIVGHTDNQGTLEYNMNLSKRRATAVEAALVRDYGIAGNRLSAWGVGYLSPVASNRNEAGRAKNRRVELVEK